MPRAHRTNATLVSFRCPGCETAHSINTMAWNFSGDFDLPTFVPSVLVTYDGYEASAESSGAPPKRCHSFVTEGRIQFLNDSTHKLAGQTVDLPEWR